MRLLLVVCRVEPHVEQSCWSVTSAQEGVSGSWMLCKELDSPCCCFMENSIQLECLLWMKHKLHHLCQLQFTDSINYDSLLIMWCCCWSLRGGQRSFTELLAEAVPQSPTYLCFYFSLACCHDFTMTAGLQEVTMSYRKCGIWKEYSLYEKKYWCTHYFNKKTGMSGNRKHPPVEIQPTSFQHHYPIQL